VSNSTDPLQPLEDERRDTLFTLEQLARRRHRFTSVTLLTKNPAALTDERYLRVLHRLNALPPDHPRAARFQSQAQPPLRVECSLAFFDDAHRRLLDPAAPSVESRLAAIRFLREENIPVNLRIDPLFPRDPLPDGRTMAEFGLPDVQSLADLESLVRFCRETGVTCVVYSMAKITRPRVARLPPLMEKMRRVYEHLSPDQSPAFRGGAWRLPDAIAAERVVRPFLDLCRRHAIEARPCRANLLATP
jgi:DNA repair photolyase